MRTDKSVSTDNLLISILLSSLGLVGCGQGVVVPTLDGLGHTSAALSLGSLLEVNGSYGTNCAQRSGDWSAAIGGYASLTNSPLTVMQGDSGCSLILTSILIGSSGTTNLYTPSAPTLLGASFAASGMTLEQNGMGQPLYANAEIEPDLSFNSDFTINIVYSDDPRLVVTGISANYGVAQASVTIGSVSPPDYGLDLSGLNIQTNQSSVVQMTGGSAILDFMTVAGQQYAVTSTQLGANPSAAAIAADFQNATPSALSGNNPSIPASAFDLVGEDLSGSPQLNLIVQNQQMGLSAYELFQITFNAP